MSKLSRTVLKEIVKECIVEIFEESFFRDNNLNLKENKRTRPRTQRPRPSKQSSLSRPSLDHVSYDKKNVFPKNDTYDKKIDNISSKITSDPVFADIFKDTAKTTLQAQISAESGRSSRVTSGGDRASMIVNQSDPSDLFTESVANKWATLAFSESVKK